jgi:hypothetical protein
LKGRDRDKEKDKLIEKDKLNKVKKDLSRERDKY